MCQILNLFLKSLMWTSASLSHLLIHSTNIYGIPVIYQVPFRRWVWAKDWRQCLSWPFGHLAPFGHEHSRQQITVALRWGCYWYTSRRPARLELSETWRRSSSDCSRRADEIMQSSVNVYGAHFTIRFLAPLAKMYLILSFCCHWRHSIITDSFFFLILKTFWGIIWAWV